MQGEYSYVDPLGALITVRYKADENGYTETRESQANFLTTYSGSGAFEAAPAAPKPVQPRPVYSKPVVQAARPPQNDLIAQIIAQLTPFIRSTVSDSLTGETRASN